INMRNLIRTLIVAVLVGFIGSQAAQAETKRALLIGISDYGNANEDPNKWANISGANDIALLTPLFKEQGFTVTSLVDAQATHAGITKALEKLAKSSKKGDVVYIHFSMHGQPFEDLNGDEEDGWDEALIPIDAQMIYSEGIYDGKNHLLDDELEGYFNDIRKKIGTNGQLYVILDACHSGTASRGDDDHVRGTREGFTRSGKNYTPDRTQETNDYFTVATAKGQSPVTFIEACRSYQVNREVRDVDTNTWYGSLSYYIAQSMKEHQIDSSDNWIEAVKTGMSNNRRLRKQNVVIEKSE
ncbi:MAG: caspase family protein, partial [Lactobacillus sp.]|nr:caspase family protein [Lactobacillus sp.]